MSDIALEFDHIWKKFKRGEKHNSLREAIPAITRRLFSGNSRVELQEQEFWAVKDVSFEVKRGEALGIIGPNGAGKSTILKLLSGILKPNKGQMRVNGRLSALIEVGAGFHPDLTGRENIYLNGAILGMKRIEIDKKFDEIVEFSGISEFIDTPVKRYSSGMYARLGFSVAAHVDPDILLIDEVLSVGDLQFQQKCFAKIQSMIKEGTTVVLISHNLSAVESVCERSIVLSKGEKISDAGTGAAIGKYLSLNINSDVGKSQALNPNVVSKEMIIETVELLDSSGEACSMVKSGDEIILRVQVASKAEVQLPVFGFIVRNENGMLVYDTNTVYLGLQTGNYPAGQEITLEYKHRVNLADGIYSYSIGLADADTRRYFDWKESALRLMVNSSGHFKGIADLCCTLHIHKDKKQ